MRMTEETAKEYIKAHPEEAVRTYYPDRLEGIYTNKAIRCFNPSAHTNGDKNPSMKFYESSNKFYCFSESKFFDTFDIISLATGITNFNDLIKEACKLYNIELTDKHTYTTERTNKKNMTTTTDKVKEAVAIVNTSADEGKTQKPGRDYTNFFKQSQKALNENIDIVIEYLKGRGLEISEEILKKSTIGFTPSFSMDSEEHYNDEGQRIYPNKYKTPCLIFPTSATTFTARAIENKEGCRKSKQIGRSAPPFNYYNALFKKYSEEEAPTPIFITEGELDSLTYLSLSVVNFQSISIASTNGVNNLLKHIKKDKDKITTKSFILALDKDSPGMKAQEKLKEGLQQMGFLTVEATYKGKDPNESITENKLNFMKSAAHDRQAALDLQKEKAEEGLQGFNNKYQLARKIESFFIYREEEETRKPIYTGFRELDKALYKGLHPELYIIGAESSTGKTTLLNQIAENIAKSGQPVFIFSMENDTNNLTAKSISRLIFKESFSMLEEATTDKEQREIKEKELLTAQQILYGKEETAEGLQLYETLTEENAHAEFLIRKAAARLKEYSKNLYIFDNSILDTESIENTIQEFKKLKKETPVIVVDYLQIMKAKANFRGTDKERLDEIIADLKAMTVKYKTPVLLISSTNRQAHTDAKKKNEDEEKVKVFSYSAFTGSSSIEFTADTLITMVESVEEEPEEEAIKQRVIILNILKNRSGARTDKYIYLTYYPEYNYFTEYKA